MKHQKRWDHNFSMQENIQNSDRMFEIMGQNTNKNLKNYDCYQEEYTPQQWVQKCLSSDGPHATCPIYINATYIWAQVWVIDYNQKNEKFIIKLQNGQVKEVTRLSLIFNEEDIKKFKERVEIAKYLHNNAQEELRFVKFVENVPQNLFGNLTDKIRTSISNKLYTLKRNKPSKQTQSEQLLMQDVEREYLLFQKKNHVITQMGLIEYMKTWEPNRIRNRYEAKSYRCMGNIVQFDYSFKLLKQHLSPVILFNQTNLIKTFLSIAARQYTFKYVQLFNYKFVHENLPITIQDYENKQIQFHNHVLKSIQIQFRQFIRDEVQDKLRDTYNFYQSEVEEYQKSELKRVIKLVDNHFNTFLRESVFTQNINEYVEFIRSFLPPQDLSEGIWTIKKQPLIQLNLLVLQSTIKFKQKKVKKNKDGGEQIEEPEPMSNQQLIYLEPSIQQIKGIVLGLLEKLAQTTNSINYMEKDLLPLIELQQFPAYAVEFSNQEIQIGVQKILTYLEIGLEQPLKIVDDFNKYNFLLEEEIQNVFKLLFGKQKDIQIVTIDVQAVREKLYEYKRAIQEIQNLCIDEKNIYLFQVRTKHVKQHIISKANELIQHILQKLSEIVVENTEQITDAYTQIISALQIFPRDEKQLVELQHNVQENAANLSKIKQEMNFIMKFYEILDDYWFVLPDDKQLAYWVLYSKPMEVLVAINEASRNITSQEERFLHNLDREKNDFCAELKQLYKEFAVIKKFSDHKNLKVNSSEASLFMDKYEKAVQRVLNFNDRETIFKQNSSIYVDLDQLLPLFTPYYNLWMQGMEFDQHYFEWMSGPFLQMNYADVEKKVFKTYQKQIVITIRKFEELNDDNALGVANEVKLQIDKFISIMWIIEFLTTEAMNNPRRSAPHWKELFRETQIANIEPNDDMTLTVLINSGVTAFRDTIEEISKKAEKQWNIEKKMKEIEEIVKLQNIDLMLFKQTGTYVLKSIDEVQQILDDQLNIMMMMKGSPYIKPLIKQANTLEQRIICIQDTIEEMMKCQRGWMYLEPIFISDDIKKKLPMEQRIFERIDGFWRETMHIFSKDPSIWDNIDSERMKNDLLGYNRSLDVIQKSLSDYLETKRRYFPRFYFLSDEELLEILADTKDPLKVQKHINKCFEAINLLDFTEKQTIKGMISAEKENVLFIKEIDVNEGDRKGNVEIWLVDIEKMMIETLIKKTRDCGLDIETKRTEWVQNWPAQILLSVNMARWTNGSEVAIQNSKLGQRSHTDIFLNQFLNIQEYLVYLEAQQQDIVNLVRQDLKDLVRMTLGAIIVLDVHAKDVITELLVKDIRDMDNFMWISQLRYYWQEDRKEPMMWVKMINAVIQYGFEYLGNSTRLVITPLTDRCYRTLMGAKHLQYGGAPEGPAGTGKTETTKDLAKALAVQCVVFNCSDGLNYLAMRKFFKGLASSGAWCCFDEFNRINLEVLSVIAQQVLSIYTAVKEKKKNFVFDDDEIALVLSCHINITMNPGYAGRSDLPDNLKALFRPCAMMVPDYALISEIYLSSVGFSDARNLARKIVASLRLSSEQLSSQDHYDFGMRALKAILTAAGYLKRSMAGEIEDIVCLRALMDVNIPKFTINDVPLFLSITSDLFPGLKQPEIDYGKLLQSLIESCQEKKFQLKQNFLQKCIQLYDTIGVRHGLMVVGAAFSGKSSVIEALRSAMSRLKGTENFVNCAAIKLNPKSITSDQLYGRLDPDTKAWTDGIAAIIMRNAASDNNNPERKWILFDGPVDAIWIENMNTVLDDNKKLCLTSGEIIKLSNQMTMMFEVEDLAVASPATVSRCGMVFQETQLLGWIVLIQSYCQSISNTLSPYKQHLENYLVWISDNTLAWCQKHAKFLVHKSEMNMICSLLKIVQTFIVNYEQEGVKLPKDIEEILNQIILFSTIWSIGAAIDENSRKTFSDYILHLVTANAEIPKIYKTELYLLYPFKPLAIVHKIPEKTNIFEVIFVPEKSMWLNWSQTIDRYFVTKGGEFNKIIVPTIDTIRNNYFVHRCVKNKYHLLLCGPTGTGKTANIINEINKNYFNAQYTNLCTSFSGQTKVNQVQRLIDSKLSTRRRKGYYGPEEGKRHIVIFVDDVNMPTKEVFGAQPPIELLRQWQDHGGWYDLDTKDWKYLQDIVFLTAMLPSGTQVTMRYLRHFFLLYVPPFEADSMTNIFSNILDWFFINLQKEPTKAIRNLSDTIIRSTIQIYNQIQNSTELLPTPAKSHYIYNLRDISKVFQGISKATIKSFNSDNDFIKLWANECERVFKDRLINDEDQDIFSTILKKIISQNFKKEWDDLVQVQPLMWASFVPGMFDGNVIRDVYCEVTDRELLKTICLGFLDQYNQIYSSNRMNLVLFVSALGHLVKIVRIITTSLGHALLVGVGGSGRKSLATLSTFIAFQTETFQIDQKTWSEDLIKAFKLSGLDECTQQVLLFSDTQISKESYLEDICNILNKGEVPNLFTPEEKAKLMEDISKPGTPNEKYLFFIGECKKNLHLVLTFSPVGESFRRRLRTFPTLVNCTTIDWFLPWPQDALRSTANNHFIKTMNLNDEDMRNKLVEIAVDMQLRITNLSKRYLDELRRYYYVTPTSYLELLAIFNKILTERTQDVNNQITRYESGVKKIQETEVSVAVMQKELEELQPQLIIKTKENLEMLAILQVKQKEADVEREVCEADAKDCAIIKDEANKLSSECQTELDKVIPLLLEAASALDNITKDDMNTLKSFVAPPVSAALVMEGLCYAFDEDKNVKWIPKPEGKPGEKIQEFWDYSKKKLLNDKLIKRVKDFKEDQILAISEKNVEKLKHFVKNPLFEKEKVFNASKAAGNLSLWVRAVVDTYFALLVVNPKKAELKIAEAKLKEAEELLQQKKDTLQGVMDLLAQLQAEYDQARQEKENLEAKVKKCQVQIERADKLISGLAGEKVAWGNKSIKFRKDTLSTTGDSLLSSGIIAYLGAFPIQYRDQTISQWRDLLTTLKITYSPDFSLQNILSDPITIGQWCNNFKLPNDSFSIDNAIILKNSSRWPLMIDPQTQANTWIKKSQASRNIKILRPSQSYNELNLQLQSCIQFGFPVILENVGEEIDQIFEPVLQKKLIKQQGSYYIRLSDGKLIDYNPDFCFYMTTKLPRPHYPPEICVKVTLLNFQVTALGLEDQITNIVVQIEEPIKDRQRQTNIEEFFNNKEKQRSTEDLILKLLNQASGNILDDENLIMTLQTSKLESVEIEQALKKSEHFQVMFDGIRRNYNPVAQRVSNLYFVILDLAYIEPTYQWSLEFYIILFIKSIEKTVKDKENRINNLIDKFQEFLYDSICRSLLEKDKLIFSLLICQKVLEIKKKLNSALIRFVMVGGTLTDAPKPIPQNAKWLSNKAWCTIIEVDRTLPEFKGFLDDFERNLDQWCVLANHENPIDQPLPGKWNNISMYEKLVIVRILFPQKFSQGVMQLIQTEMGKNFITPPPFDLEFSVKDGTPFTPLIFILSPGADPRLEILNTADKLGRKADFMQISLGQGQGQIAESSIEMGIIQGRWVLLQNCHLAPSFMPQLERILEDMEARKDVDSNFRIWLTSMPSEIFPPIILMKGIKMTYEPPRGMKNNLLRVFSTEDKKSFEDCSKAAEWKKLFFGLAFFHGLILERRKFGPLGWNIPYEFTMTDFTISCSQLKMFLNEYEEIPWDALNYMVAEANYGGRVTDTKDRRLIKVILSDFWAQKVLNNNYKYSKSGIYYSPNEGNLQEFIDHINNMPLRQETELFGLHPNAEITSAIMETNSICNTVLSLLPRSVGGAGATPDEIIKIKCKEILQKLPKQFDQDAVQKSHPVAYKESMNTVLQQELIRFNKLTNIIRSSVINLGKAIDGLLTMSNDLEKVFDSIFDNKQPDLWQKSSYPSIKPLGSYLNNFIERLQFIQKWIDDGSPPTYWISGFFFTQSFLTGTMQNYARKHCIPIDTLAYDFVVIKDDQYDLKKPPADGCYIYGLYMDGAKWDNNLWCINESLPMELYSTIPYIWLVPTAIKKNYDDDQSIYCCPTYKTSARKGVLSTTGHSTNFVFDMYLSIHKDSNPNFWVKMGVAAITQLDD